MTQTNPHASKTGSAIRRDDGARARPREMLAIVESLTTEDPPPAGVERLTVRRKAEVVAGVFAGLISRDEAFRRYRLSTDEFLRWQRQLSNHGVLGLRGLRPRVPRSS